MQQVACRSRPAARWHQAGWLHVLTLFFAFLLAPLAAQAQSTNIPYLDATGVQQIAPSVTDITDCSVTTLTEGWYLVSGSFSCSGTITVSGDVKLILADGSNVAIANSTVSSNAGLNVELRATV